jgi:non-heme chloroperoxidase
MSVITPTDGTRIFFKDWGAGQPLVFSHCSPLSAKTATASSRMVPRAERNTEDLSQPPAWAGADQANTFNADLLAFVQI